MPEYHATGNCSLHARERNVGSRIRCRLHWCNNLYSSSAARVFALTVSFEERYLWHWSCVTFSTLESNLLLAYCTPRCKILIAGLRSPKCSSLAWIEQNLRWTSQREAVMWDWSLQHGLCPILCAPHYTAVFCKWARYSIRIHMLYGLVIWIAGRAFC